MKTALLGGTFDPIHNGHLYIAREASRILSLDQVKFLVSGGPPHKQQDPVSDSRHRLAMTSLAVMNEEKFVVSDEELRRGGLSYTIDTLEKNAEELGHGNICFIAGSDVLRDIHTWKSTERLLEKFCIFFVQRPGEQVDLDNISLNPDLRRRIHKTDTEIVPEIVPGQSWLATLNSPGISSSVLREKISSHETNLARFLPGNVLEYAIEHGLYENRY
jgi:nicotinate-nucleotide adenylyltransferase